MRARLILGGVATVLVAALLLAGGPAAAKKPPKPPPEPPPQVDTGTIYFGHAQMVYRMNPDGGGKTAVIGRTGVEPYNLVPSLLPHDGKRWFLLFEPVAGETYPSGKNRFELFAVTAEGDSVQLTNDASIEPKFSGGFPGVPSWAVHSGTVDGKVSFLAVRWDNDVIVDHGVYWFQVEPDNLSAHSAVAHGSGGAFLPVDFGISDAGKLHAGYDWSPTGNAIVFRDGETGPGIRKAEQANGWVAVQLTTDGSGPRWSPAGDRIAFYGDQDTWTMGDEAIYTIRTDGSDRKKVASRHVGPGVWSPSGTHLVYWKGLKAKNYPIYPGHDIERITVSGDDKTNLTRDIDGKPYPFAWRATE